MSVQTLETRRPSALVFDFDGVVIDSALVKLEAFAEVLPRVASVRAYLESSQGKPRQERFEWVYRELLHLPYDDTIGTALDARLTSALDARLDEIPLIPGVDEFILRMSARLPLFVVSAAPLRDVERLLKLHGLRESFTEIEGAVHNKAVSIDGIRARLGANARQLVFFGDTMSDYRSAIESGACFVGVVPVLGGSEFGTLDIPRLSDFGQAEELLRTLVAWP
jgi:phosphoglycolate phosphatase